MKKRSFVQYVLLFFLFAFNTLLLHAQELTPQKHPKKDKWGYVDQSGKWVIKAKYTKTYPFKNGIGRIEKDGKIGYIKENGDFLLECDYISVYEDEHLFFAKDKYDINWKLYYFNTKTLFDLSLSRIEKTSNGVVFVQCKASLSSSSLLSMDQEYRAGLEEIIQQDGGLNFVIVLDKERNFVSAAFGASLKKQYGFYLVGSDVYTPSGDFLVNAKDEFKDYSFGDNKAFFAAGKNGAFIIDSSYKIYELKGTFVYGDVQLATDDAGDNFLFKHFIMQEKLDQIYDNNDGSFSIFKDGKWGFVDQYRYLPCVVTAPDNDQIRLTWLYEDSYFRLRGENGKWGIYNKEKDLIILPCEYDLILPLSIGAYCWKNNSQGLYDFVNQEMIVAPGGYDSLAIETASLGSYCILAWKDGKAGALNPAGEQVVPCRYDKVSARNIASGLYEVYSKNGVGLISEKSKGKEILPCGVYTPVEEDGDKSEHFQTTFLGVLAKNKNGRMGILDEATGKIVVPFSYDTFTRGANFNAGLTRYWENGNVTVAVYSRRTKKLIVTETFKESENWRLEIFAHKYLVD